MTVQLALSRKRNNILDSGVCSAQSNKSPKVKNTGDKKYLRRCEARTRLVALDAGPLSRISKYLDADSVRRLRLAGLGSNSFLVTPLVTQHLRLKLSQTGLKRLLSPSNANQSQIARQWCARDAIRLDRTITDKQLKYLLTNEYLKSVKSLDLTHCRRLTNASLKRIGQIKQLKTLKLHGCHQFSDLGLLELESLQKLESVNLSSCNISDKGIKGLLNSKTLKVLVLDSCDDITDCALRDISSSFFQLNRLSLMGCDAITDRGLELVCYNLKKLHYLSLLGCEQITDDGVAKLAALHKLETVNLNGCEQITDSGVKGIQRKGLHISKAW